MKKNVLTAGKIVIKLSHSIETMCALSSDHKAIFTVQRHLFRYFFLHCFSHAIQQKKQIHTIFSLPDVTEKQQQIDNFIRFPKRLKKLHNFQKNKNCF